MRKEKVITRLKYLYSLELINAFFLPFAFLTYCYVHNERPGLNSIVALSLNGIILLEGSYLWFRICQRLTNPKADRSMTIYKTFKITNIGLIIITLTALLTNPFSSSYDKVGAIGFTVLAILEHINYFEIQLMYDNKNDLKYLRQFGLKRSKLKMLLTKGGLTDK